MTPTEDEWAEWIAHPVTQAVVEWLKRDSDLVANSLVSLAAEDAAIFMARAAKMQERSALAADLAQIFMAPDGHKELFETDD